MPGRNLLVALTILVTFAACGSGDRAPASSDAAPHLQAGHRAHRRRRHLPEPDLHQVVRRLHQEDRRPDQLPVDRLRRRHPPVHRRHGGLRRHRRPDDRRADRRRQGRTCCMSRRCSAPSCVDLQPARPRRHQAQASTDRPLADIFLGRITKWNDTRHRRAQPGREAADQRHHRGPPLGRLGHELHLHRLLSKVSPRLEGQGRARHLGQLAGRASAARATRA